MTTTELSITSENYLKALYHLEHEFGDAAVPLGRLAEDMEVVPGTATAMVKRLAVYGFVDYVPYQGARLTHDGRHLATRVLRRHRLVEAFLVEVLGLDWSDVHEDAEHLEHAISDHLLERIDEFLGRPSIDPHGDPIPDSNGHIRDRGLEPLTACHPGRTYRVARVMNQDQDFLQFVDRNGLRPGQDVTLVSRDHAADSILIDSEQKKGVTMGTAAATKILVEPLGG